MNVRTYLEQQQVHPQLIRAVEEFRNQYPVEEKVKYRVSDPMMPFYGTEILEMGIAALLQKENLLLSGSKATGKNVLAENLAWIFQRPTYNISFHVNTGSGDLIGTDTFEDNQVKLRKGSIYQCAEYGDLAYWMKSIWQKTMRYLCYMQLWTIEEVSMCRDMTRLSCIPRHVLSER